MNYNYTNMEYYKEVTSEIIRHNSHNRGLCLIVEG
jgi:hypothetical protein